MELSIITDEVSQQLEEIIRFCRQFDLKAVELRSVEGLGAFDFTPGLAQRMREQFGAAGIKVCSLSLPFYKCEYNDLQTRRQHLESLRRSLELAQILGVKIVRGFCFWRHEDAPLTEAALCEAYAPVLPLLADSGVVMGLEADPSVNGHTSAILAGYIRAIGSPSVRAVWDGGNLLFAPDGEVPVDGYALLKDLICHVHIKDAMKTADGEQAVRVGTGEANIAGQLRLLVRDGYQGYLSLETHYRLTSEINEETLRLPGGFSFSDGAAAASAESMVSLRQLMREAGIAGY